MVLNQVDKAKARRSTLGASEVAAVLGLSPWQTPLGVWRAKVLGEVNQIPDDLAYFGRALEDPIAQRIRDKHPEVGGVSVTGISVGSVEYPWLSATPDRLAWGDDSIAVLGQDWYSGGIPVELKTSSAFSRRSWDDGVPDYYRIQSIVQQGILGTDYGWLAVLHGGNSFELHRVDFDTAVWEQIVRLTGEWWEAHVVAGVAPEPTSTAEAVSLWPGDSEVTVEGDEELLSLWEAYGLIQAEIVEAQGNLEGIKLELQKAMQDAVALTYQGRELFTWKPRAGARRFDDKALLADHPDVHAQYMRQGAPTRTFLRKTTKEVME